MFNVVGKILGFLIKITAIIAVFSGIIISILFIAGDKQVAWVVVLGWYSIFLHTGLWGIAGIIWNLRKF